MEAAEVSALLLRRKSRLLADHDGGGSPSKREEIVIDAQEEEEFLRCLEEQLQLHADRLDQMDLLLAAKQINYIAFRLHEALEPKRDPETNVIQAWTIQPHTQLKIKMSSHIQVLKLSTILREVRRVRIHQHSQLRSPIDVEIFPSLRSIEVVHSDAAALYNAHCFARQLRLLRVEHSAVNRLSQLLSPDTDSDTPVAWTRLESLRINCCQLATLDRSINSLERIQIADFGWNEITRFDQPATCSTIRWLDLCHNKLTAFPPLVQLHALKVLDLSMNSIESMRGVETLSALADLNVASNMLTNIREIELLTGSVELTRLVLRDNPFTRRPDYRREVLFYLGDGVELDDERWNPVELSSMKHSRRFSLSESAKSKPGDIWERAANPVRGTTGATMVYPSLPKQKGIRAVAAEIVPPPRLYSPRRRRPPTGASGVSDRHTEDGTATEITDIHDEDTAHGMASVHTVDDYFRYQGRSVESVGSSGRRTSEPLTDAVIIGSDSEDSSSEKGRNRSRKYTESDFMRDFEEEEELLHNGVELDDPNGRQRRSSSNGKRATKRRSECSVNVRVLLSADDAAIFDLSLGSDGLAAIVEVKANEILETLHVPDRESTIGFSRRLPDIVAVGTATHVTRGKIVVLKLRKAERSFGSVTYQIDAHASLSRMLSALLTHLYAPQAEAPLICVCSSCGAVSHLTLEYLGVDRDSISISACLLCTSLNVREVSRERMLALYASEDLAQLAKRIKASSERLAHSEQGFIVEEQATDPRENRECVLLSSMGIREAVDRSEGSSEQIDPQTRA